MFFLITQQKHSIKFGTRKLSLKQNGTSCKLLNALSDFLKDKQKVNLNG